MQNLPITANPTITSTQAPVPTDNNSVSNETEPFGSVLARQRASKSKSEDSPTVDKQTAPVDSGDTSLAVNATDPQPPLVSDIASIVTGDKLAAIFSASTVISNHSIKEKAHPQASSQNAANTLPSDMLAMLLPVNVATSISTPLEKTDSQASGQLSVKGLTGKLQSKPLPGVVTENNDPKNTKGTINPQLPSTSILSGETLSTSESLAAASDQTALSKATSAMDKKTQFQPVTTFTLGAEQQTAPNKAIPAQLGVLGSDNALDAAKNNTFTATLEAISKDNFTAQKNDSVKTTLPNQTEVANAMASLVQNGLSPLAANQSGAQVVQAVINTPVSHDAWGNEFNQKVTWMVTQHDQTAQLHLNPPNLGPLDVVLKVSGDHATAFFTSPHAAVRDAVEQALPQLRNMLADNGITLGNAMVSDQSPKDQQAWQTSQQQKGNAGTSRTLEANSVTAGIPAVTNVSLGRIHQGMVDTFV